MAEKLNRKIIDDLYTRKIQQEMIVQVEKRPTWKANDSISNLEKLLLDEYKEFRMALEAVYLGDSAWELASEVGDVLIYYFRRLRYSDIPVSDEIQNAVHDVLSTADLAGFNLSEVIKMKLARNEEKFPAEMFQLGCDYSENASLLKESW